MDDPVVSLSDLLPHQAARVTDVQSTDEAAASRLKSLGICTGRRVEMVKSGDPLIIDVHGSRIGLSAELARGIQVRRQ